MKKILLFPLAIALSFGSAAAFAAQTKNGCEIKKQKIQTQIDYAKKHNNPYRVAGLEEALANVETYCTPESLYRDSQKKVTEKENDLKERELDLQEAKNKGDTDKIRKRERKLREAQDELAEAKEELLLNQKFIK